MKISTGAASRFTNPLKHGKLNLLDSTPHQSRVVRYDYTSLDGTNNCETRIELLQGVEIAREYTVIYPAATHHIRCVTPGASWTNANNLVTITYYQQDIALAGKPQRVISPDGTMQLYQYQELGSELTETVLSGQPDANFTEVTNGTKTVTVTAQAGMVLSRTTYDIVLGDSYRLEYEFQGHDSLGRPTTTSYPGGTYTTLNYDCCGLESSVDRDGVTTTYVYDPLHRQIGTIRNDITTTNLLV